MNHLKGYLDRGNSSSISMLILTFTPNQYQNIKKKLENYIALQGNIAGMNQNSPISLCSRKLLAGLDISCWVVDTKITNPMVYN